MIMTRDGKESCYIHLWYFLIMKKITSKQKNSQRLLWYFTIKNQFLWTVRSGGTDFLKGFQFFFTSEDAGSIMNGRMGQSARRISSYTSQRERRTMGTAHQKRQRPLWRDDEVRGESKVSADAPPRRLRARTQPVNMRATAKQRGCDRGTRSNGCEFVLLFHSAV